MRARVFVFDCDGLFSISPSCGKKFRFGIWGLTSCAFVSRLRLGVDRDPAYRSRFLFLLLLVRLSYLKHAEAFFCFYLGGGGGTNVATVWRSLSAARGERIGFSFFLSAGSFLSSNLFFCCLWACGGLGGVLAFSVAKVGMVSTPVCTVRFFFFCFNVYFFV